MKKLNLVVLLSICSILIGCATIHYTSTKHIEGKGEDIKTPFGKITGVNATFDATVDVWIPWKPKDNK